MVLGILNEVYGSRETAWYLCREYVKFSVPPTIFFIFLGKHFALILISHML